LLPFGGVYHFLLNLFSVSTGSKSRKIRGIPTKGGYMEKIQPYLKLEGGRGCIDSGLPRIKHETSIAE